MTASSTVNESLWRSRAFTLFWWARSISAAGSAITGSVLPILVYNATGSAASTALLTLCHAGPYVVVGLLAGGTADRVDRKTLLVAAEAANVLVLASVPVAAWLGILTLGQIYAVAILSATLFVWYDTAASADLRSMVGSDRLVAANSALWMASTLVAVVAPPISVVLASKIGPANALAFDAASYAISALLLACIPRRIAGSTAVPTRGRVADGLRCLLGHPTLRTLTLLNLGAGLSGGAVYGLVVVFWARGLGLPATDARFGWLLAVCAGGAALASLLVPRVKRSAALPTIAAGMAANPVLLVSYALAPNWVLAAAALGVWNLVHTAVMILGVSLRQEWTPEHLQGRVNAVGRMIALGSVPVGAALVGTLVDLIGARWATLLGAMPVMLSALAAPRLLARQRDLAPAEGEPNAN